MKKHIIISFLLTALLTSCQTMVWNNPYDPDCPKVLWTPTDFKAMQSGSSVTLNWSQPMNNITGFRLTKKVDTGAATDMTAQSKGITTLIDPSLTGGKLHTYTIVAYAGNNLSNVVTTTVTPILAAGGIATTAANSITSISAISGATIISDGGSTITARGVCWGTTSGPTIAGSKTTDGTGIGTFISSLTGLSPNTNYFVRAFAINSAGTSYGNEVSFRTLTGISTISTTSISNITATTASSGGTITSDGGLPITSRGVCWATTVNPVISGNKTIDGTGIGIFSSSLVGLIPNTYYYLRAYATNSTVTIYGNEMSFKTPVAPILFNSIKTYGTMSDVDGNTYKTIQIGTQLWMAENLKTTKYKDGSTIPLVTDNNTWNALTTGAFCWYENDAITYKSTYGALYNWYSVQTNKVCPTGWHVPTDAEYSALTAYLGGESISGGKLKETGILHWTTPNTGATNDAGFSLIPGGQRDYQGSSYFLARDADLWSSTESSSASAWYRNIIFSSEGVLRINSPKQTGYSVRCLSGDLAIPTITTTPVSNISITTSTSGGNISFDGGTAVSARGVCWSTTANPTITNSKSLDGTGSGSFTSNITGLSSGTTYYVRAFATNSIGTAYGQQEVFVTSYSTVSDVDGSACKLCHTPAQVDLIVVQFQYALHKTGEEAHSESGNSGCSPCHTQGGFLDVVKRNVQATFTLNSTTGKYVNDYSCDVANAYGELLCRTCHSSIHESYATTGLQKYTTVAAVPLTMWAGKKTIDLKQDAGSSNLCIKCHQPRPFTFNNLKNPNYTSNVLDYAALTSKPTEVFFDGSSAATMTLAAILPGYRTHPHSGTVGIIVAGVGGIEFPGTLGYASAKHATVASCAHCHMAATNGANGGHTFVAINNFNGCNVTGCHTGVNASDAKYWTNPRTTIKGLLATLAAKLQYNGVEFLNRNGDSATNLWYGITANNYDGYMNIYDPVTNPAGPTYNSKQFQNPAPASSWTTVQKTYNQTLPILKMTNAQFGAMINFQLCLREYSLGIHNFDYSKALLTNSITIIP